MADTMISSTFQRDLAAARRGCMQSRGALTERCRKYLLLMAQGELNPRLKVKVAPSDLVQEACLEAVSGFDAFRGHSEAEMQRWLRRIMQRQALMMARTYQSQKRDLRREEELWRYLAEPTADMPDGETPSRRAMRQERASIVECNLSGLPDIYRRVLLLRSVHQQTFAEIGSAVHRSPEAARKLWVRGLELLGHRLRESDVSR